MKDANEVWHYEHDHISQIMLSYFNNLFIVPQGRENCFFGHLTSISHVQNEALLAPISSEEVKDALFSMHPDKVSWLNGFNTAFYQHFFASNWLRCCAYVPKNFLTLVTYLGGKWSIVLIPKIKEKSRDHDRFTTNFTS